MGRCAVIRMALLFAWCARVRLIPWNAKTSTRASSAPSLSSSALDRRTRGPGKRNGDTYVPHSHSHGGGSVEEARWRSAVRVDVEILLCAVATNKGFAKMSVRFISTFTEVSRRTCSIARLKPRQTRTRSLGSNAALHYCLRGRVKVITDESVQSFVEEAT